MDANLFVYGLTLAYGAGIAVATFYVVILEAVDFFHSK